MNCVVFYSWQSDRPNPTNRGFIQKALENATKAIRNDESIQVEPVVDRDTAGVPGSPDIGNTIFEKIEKAQIFVCDISLINTEAVFTVNQDGERQIDEERTPRPTPNPNVLLELGYALKALGPSRVLMVLNTAYGKTEQLPFDLRTKRVIPYYMPLEAEERASERKRFENVLEIGLRDILAGVEVQSVGEVIQPKSRAALAVEAIEAAKPNQAYLTRKFMEDVAEQINSLAPDLANAPENQLDELLVQAIDQSPSLVIEVARVAEAIAAMNASEAARAMYKGFEHIAQGYSNKIGSPGYYRRIEFDFHRFIGHELFVTFISFLVKEQRWEVVADILDEGLQVKNLDSPRSGMPQDYTYLSTHVELLDYRNQRLGLKRPSPRADLLNQRHSEGEISKVIPMQQFMEADYFLFLRAVLQEGNCDSLDWIPWSVLYMGGRHSVHVPGYLTEAVREKNAMKLLRPLKVKDIEALRKGLAECAPTLKELYKSRVTGWSHPLADFKIDTIGSKQ